MTVPPRAVTGTSRFTHIGRHQSFLRQLVSFLPKEARRCLLLGPGPVEPILVAHLLSRAFPGTVSFVHAVDESPAVVGLLNALVSEHPVDLHVLAATCRDDCDRPGSPPNSNFTTRLVTALDELAASGFPDVFSTDNGALLAAHLLRAEITAACIPAQQFLAASDCRTYDLVYAGLLLTNLRKSNPAAVQELLGTLRPVVARGILGVGSSLSPEHGAGRDLLDLERGGFHPRALVLENVIVSGGLVYGDYGLLAMPAADLRCEPSLAIEAHLWDTLQLHTNVSCREIALAIDGGVNECRIVIAARCERRGKWEFYSVDLDEVTSLLTEEQRWWFSGLQLGDIERRR